MTLKIERVKHAEYLKDGSIAFYVLCEGVSGILDVSFQEGFKNEYNNSVLRTWLDTNTPDAYSNRGDIARDAIKTYKESNSVSVNKSIEELLVMTDAEKLQYKSDKEAYMEGLSLLLVEADNIDNEYVSEKIKKITL